MTNLHVTMSSAELARCREITTKEQRLGGHRVFAVGNTGTRKESRVMYWIHPDMLFCESHKAWDDCECSGRLRMCGIITGHVVPDVKHWKKVAL